MQREAVSIQEARDLPGLRVILLKGLPSPWSQAARGILHIKNIDYVLVHPGKDDPPNALQEWTGQASFPAAMYESEKPRSGWAEILFLAERLAPQPALVPADPAARAVFFGLCHELAGEMGVGWCRRLQMMQNGMSSDPPDPIAQYLADKYGYTEQSGAAALGRVVDVLTVLSDRLRDQREAGHRYLMGPSLTALDVYWATFCNLLSPLPPDLLPIPERIRPMFTARDPGIFSILEHGLLEHRDFIYRKHLELPVPL
jgi:glutathione S-transferase